MSKFPNPIRPTPTVVRPPLQRQTPPELEINARISRQSNSPEQMAASPARTNPPLMSVEEAVDQALANLQYVQVAKNMGMEDRLIKDVLKRKYEANLQFYHSSEDFLEALLVAQERENTTRHSEPPAFASAAGELTSMLSLFNFSFSMLTFHLMLILTWQCYALQMKFKMVQHCCLPRCDSTQITST